MLIAVDFDGTIVDHAFPDIGKPKPYVWKVLKALQKSGVKLILNTCRENDTNWSERQFLDEAVEFCRKNGVEFHSVNSNQYGDDDFRNGSLHRRKVYANLYIDDRNFGGFPGWETVGKELGVL